MVSDPARTLLDMLVDPKLGGGSVKEMLGTNGGHEICPFSPVKSASLLSDI